MKVNEDEFVDFALHLLSDAYCKLELDVIDNQTSMKNVNGYRPFRDKVLLCDGLIAEVVKNAFDDISRMAKFHLTPGGKAPDRHKYAGFLSKWVAKTRPIQLKVQAGLNKHMEMINAYFALYVLFICLEKGVVKLKTDAQISLLYQFHFRDAPGEQLSLLAYFIEEYTKK